jgi:hypothetical protein
MPPEYTFAAEVCIFVDILLNIGEYVSILYLC